MGARKWVIAAIIVLVLAVAAFLWFYDPDTPINEEASGGPHILDENLNPQVKQLSKPETETEGCP